MKANITAIPKRTKYVIIIIKSKVQIARLLKEPNLSPNVPSPHHPQPSFSCVLISHPPLATVFISMASTSCHLPTIRANVNSPRVYFGARGAMQWPRRGGGGGVAQTGGGHLGYLHKVMWLSCSHRFIGSLQTPGVEREIQYENCRQLSHNRWRFCSRWKKHRLLLSQRDTSRDYVEICSDHISKAVLSLIILKLTQCF